MVDGIWTEGRWKKVEGGKVEQLARGHFSIDHIQASKVTRARGDDDHLFLLLDTLSGFILRLSSRNTCAQIRARDGRHCVRKQKRRSAFATLPPLRKREITRKGGLNSSDTIRYNYNAAVVGRITKSTRMEDCIRT